MTDHAPLPPASYCANPILDCPGQGAQLEEIREELKDDEGRVIGTLVFMACRLCGYRWDQS